ncbi:hypothetical protein [Mycolicibacterium agri]|uniref:Uncharacterized protein n=1 Tax=Mycolicibacterium agri TaxID=36811 RepID=A0A7I9W859_MYCAG|nr:hypothetical protein [Mycolicibacterium agri]GFG53376.1 hypothetical protein MAGR_48170 [Mycolicibacterium agri]
MKSPLTATLTCTPFPEEPENCQRRHSPGCPASGEAVRVAGHRPSPKALLDRLIDALETAGEDESRPPAERSRLKQVAQGLNTAAAQIAIAALGGAGGKLLTG